MRAPAEEGAAAGGLRASLAEILQARYDGLLTLGGRYEPLSVEELEKAVLRLRERSLRRQIEQLRFLEDEARRTDSPDEVQEYRQRIVLAMEQLQWTQAALRARTMLGRAHGSAEKAA